MYEHGEKQVSDDELREALGATTVALMNVSGADPRAALGVYRDRVLPALRG